VALETLESPHHAKGGLSLFGDAPEAPLSVQAWDEATLLGYERDALGFYLSGHPLARYRRTLGNSDISPIGVVEDREDRSEIAVAGIVNEVKTRARDKGITAYLTIEDETGSVEVLVFPDTYRKTGEILRKQAVLVVRGQVSKTEKGSKVIARDIRELSDVEVVTRYEVDLCCEDPDTVIGKLKDLRMLMDHRANGKETATVSFRFHMPDYCVVMSSHLQPGSNFLPGITGIPGGSVRVL
jgi:DNA polymerase-3 subunit alpha